MSGGTRAKAKDGKTLGDGRTEGDGERQGGVGGGSRLKPEVCEWGGDRGMKGPSQFVTFRSGPSGTTQTNGDARMGSSPSKDSCLSYKDKLLCLGESGLLEPHFSVAKALSSWKEYFARSNEKQGSKEMEGDDEEAEQEEEAVDVWRRTGKLPNLHVSAEEYDAWCKPFLNSLIVKLLGKTVNVGFMRLRMERMWASKGPERITPLSNGYFLVSFYSTEDRDYALQEGPLMIADHYVLVQRWRPNFNPWKAYHQKRVAVWVRIPDLPHELYNVESIRRIGNMVDLQKPLLPGFNHFGEERSFEYEGLHLVCFTCGRYGHRMDQCITETQSKEPGCNPTEAPTVTTTASEQSPRKEGNVMGNPKGNGQCVNYGPQMSVKREFGKNVSKVDLKVSHPEMMRNKAEKELGGINIPKDMQDQWDQVNQRDDLNKKKTDDVEDTPRRFGEEVQNKNEKQEWIQVGSKRKAGAKIKAHGKENKMSIKSQSCGKGKEIHLKRENNKLGSNLMMGPIVGETSLENKDCNGPPESELTMPNFKASEWGGALNNCGGTVPTRDEANSQNIPQDASGHSDDAIMSSEDGQGDGLPTQSTCSQ
ncbi:hypothetical protein K1719_046617 [Acacia pycnantha]|nr:hypothetical protein K1719_046617 [Acacia pycnantha]